MRTVEIMDRELERPEFWAAHYYLLVADDDHDSPELIEPLFGLTAKSVEDYYLQTLVRGDVPSFVETERRPLTVYATALFWSSVPS